MLTVTLLGRSGCCRLSSLRAQRLQPLLQRAHVHRGGAGVGQLLLQARLAGGHRLRRRLRHLPHQVLLL